jgi:hypothetical protein
MESMPRKRGLRWFCRRTSRRSCGSTFIGSGIAPSDLERIFEPFQRGSHTATMKGAGLGLAIARGFAEANGSRVWAESLEGQGATFVFALPLATWPGPLPRALPARSSCGVELDTSL